MSSSPLFPGADIKEAPRSAVSWSSVLAGAAAACALSLVLLVIGAGIGLASISPWSGAGASGTTVGVLIIAWSIAVPLFSYAVGGYIAGRLRTQWVDVHTDEVYFRDTAHGLLVWAIGTIVSAMLVASFLTSVASGGAKIGESVLSAGASTVAAASAGGAVASGGAGDAGGGNGYFIDMLLRPQQPAPSGTAPGQTDDRQQIGRIFVHSLAAGEISNEDKAYVTQLVARQTGLSPADAGKRFDDIVAQVKSAKQQAVDKAKEAADAARKAGTYASLWAFVALLVGALSASYMATVGGRLRDEPPTVKA